MEFFFIYIIIININIKIVVNIENKLFTILYIRNIFIYNFFNLLNLIKIC